MVVAFKNPNKSTLYRKIWQLSLPMILSNITVPLLGMTDIAVIGHLNSVLYIDSVSLGTRIISYIYWLLVFLRWSSSGLTAQAYGQENEKAIGVILARGIALALLIGIVIILLQNFIIHYAMIFMHPEPSLIPTTVLFLKICIWGAPAAMLNYVLVGWFIGIQNTKVPMIMLIGSNTIGMLLDIIFVFKYHFLVAGVAAATLIAQYCGIAIGLPFLYKKVKEKLNIFSLKVILHWEEVKKFLFINQNLFLRSLSLCCVYAFFTRQSAQYGTTVYAVNAILMSFQFLMACFLDGIANATEALVGEAIGQKNQAAFTRVLRSVFYTALLAACLYSLAYALFYSLLINLMTNINEVRLAAKNYALWIILSPFASVWCFILDGIFIGATRAREMRNSMLFSVICVFLPLWYFTQEMGNHGLWIAFFGFLLARAASLGFLMMKDGGM